MIVKCVEAFTGIAEAIVLCMLFESLFDRKENISPKIYPIIYIALAIGIDMSFWCLGGSVLNVVCVFLLAFAVTFLYKTKFRQKVSIPLVMIVFNTLSEMLVWYVISYLFNVTAMSSNENVELWMLGAISSKILIFALVNIIRLRLKNKKIFNSGSYWVLFVIVVAPMIITDHLLFSLTLSIDDVNTKALAIGSAVGLMVSAFVILYLYERITEQTETEHREQQYEQQIKSQSKHLDEILVMQKQLKGFRHDISNHFVALNSYFANSDYEGGMKYLSGITEALESGEIVDTGNIALDAIISTKKALADEKKIDFNLQVQIPEQLFIEASDICIIFGNALDNAVEACEKINDENKWINLSIIYDDNSVVCKIVNSVNRNKKISLKTTKQDKENHGFGLDNIKQALSKYNHVIKTEQTKDEFILSFVVFEK